MFAGASNTDVWQTIAARTIMSMENCSKANLVLSGSLLCQPWSMKERPSLHTAAAPAVRAADKT